MMPAEIQLFILNGKPLQYPQFAADGFILGKPAEPTQNRAKVGNQIYNVFVFRYPITPAKTGGLILGPAQCLIEVAVPVRRSRRSLADPFGFFDDFMERSQMTLASDPIGIQVAPLPAANVPSDFNGAVGRFTLSVSASPTNVSVGDPITLRVQITGRGQLDSLALPAIAWPDFKPYPPSSKVESTDPLGLEGIKTFEQVLTPQKADIKELPAITFSFFDPELKQYQQLRHAAIPVVVSPATPVNMAVPINTRSAPGSLSPELAHIKSRFGRERVDIRPLIMQAWFIGLQGLPILAWLAALLYRRHQDRLMSDPRLRRRREAERAVQQGLKQLYGNAAAGQAEAFFATLFRLLQEQIGGCLNLPASAITGAIVEERLRPAGLDEPLLQELHELFQVCDQARFAPATTALELNALLPRIEAVLRAMKHWHAQPAPAPGIGSGGSR
jgi:hypothetical protein